MGFGYQEVAVIDLGQVNHMETTLASGWTPNPHSSLMKQHAIRHVGCVAEFNSQRPGKKPQPTLKGTGKAISTGILTAEP